MCDNKDPLPPPLIEDVEPCVKARAPDELRGVGDGTFTEDREPCKEQTSGRKKRLGIAAVGLAAVGLAVGLGVGLMRPSKNANVEKGARRAPSAWDMSK